MNTQEANFIKQAYKRTKDNRVIAQQFYDKYGNTEHCAGPEIIFADNRKHRIFSAIDGHVLCTTASIFLGENWKGW